MQLLWSSNSFARPLNKQESTPRLNLILLKKFQAESRMEAIKTVLGWIINTRSLSIALPLDKYLKWTSQVKEILNSTRVNSKQLEILNHVAAIQNMICHFLGRLHHAFMRSVLNGWTFLRLCEIMDLNLMNSFLDIAKQGCPSTT